MKTEILNTTCELISIVFPQLDIIKKAKNGYCGVSDIILTQKLFNIINDENYDYFKWLKESQKFTEDNKNYYKIVKQIIYTINAINEEEMLYAYSNLLKAYRMKFVIKKDFLRLGFILTKLHSGDAEFLKEKIFCERIKQNTVTLSLVANGLMYEEPGFGQVGDEGVPYYQFSQLAKMLDKYALSYGNEERYKYSTDDKDILK